MKSSREPEPRHPLQQPGHRSPSDDHHQSDEPATLPSVMAMVAARPAPLPGRRPPARLPPSRHRDRGQEHEDEHGEEVLDDQPAHRDPAIGRSRAAAVLQRAEEHHRARDREAEPEDEACPPGPAPEMGDARAEQRRHRDLHDGAGQRDASHRHQVVEREVNPHAEHQQDDPDLGELLGERDVGDETRVKGAYRDAGEEVAHDRRQPQPYSEQAEQNASPSPRLWWR